MRSHCSYTTKNVTKIPLHALEIPILSSCHPISHDMIRNIIIFDEIVKIYKGFYRCRKKLAYLISQDRSNFHRSQHARLTWTVRLKQILKRTSLF